MDALALLCNLHADGPATLQRLRRLGCDSIEALASLEDDKLGVELRRDEEAARRFKREAHGLLERLKGSAAPRPPKPKESLPEPPSGAPQEPAALALPDPDETPEEPKPTLPSASQSESPSQHANVLRVLETWRVMDEESAPATHTGSRKSALEKPEEEEQRLDEAGLDGLTPRLLDRLQAMGLETLGEFAEAPSLELSRELPMPLTRVRRMQLLVRRMRIQRVLSTRDPNALDPADEPLRVLHPAAQATETPEPESASAEAGRVAEQPDREVQEPEQRAEPQQSAEPQQPLPAASEPLADSGELEPASPNVFPRERHPLEPQRATEAESERIDSGGPFA